MIDVESVVAIDSHVHAEASIRGKLPPNDLGRPMPTVPELAEMYRDLRMACVVFPVDAEALLGRPPVPNEEVAEIAAENPDVIIPFASLNPARGRGVAEEAARLVEEVGIKGFKFHPAYQAFFPNDPSVYPLYAELERLGVPALFHTGQIGRDVPIRLKYCDPIHLDDVAVDFPDLKIIMAHPSFPWQDTALSIASRRRNVYIDLSGWSPKYFPPQLVHYSNTLIKSKVLFGSDYPVLTPQQWLAAYPEAGFRDEVRDGIMKRNAARMLGL